MQKQWVALSAVTIAVWNNSYSVAKTVTGGSSKPVTLDGAFLWLGESLTFESSARNTEKGLNCLLKRAWCCQSLIWLPASKRQLSLFGSSSLSTDSLSTYLLTEFPVRQYFSELPTSSLVGILQQQWTTHSHLEGSCFHWNKEGKLE